MVTLHGHLVLKVPMLRCSSREGACQKDKARKPKKKKKIKERAHRLFLLCSSIICCFLNSCFCENRKTSRASEKTLLPSCPLFSERFFVFCLFKASFHQDQNIKSLGSKEEVASSYYYCYYIYFVPSALLGNLANIILFKFHRNFDRQVYSHFINEERTHKKYLASRITNNGMELGLNHMCNQLLSTLVSKIGPSTF